MSSKEIKSSVLAVRKSHRRQAKSPNYASNQKLLAVDYGKQESHDVIKLGGIHYMYTYNYKSMSTDRDI